MIQFLDTVLTSSTVDNCDGNTLTIDNQAEGDSSLICSSLVNYETFVRVRATLIKFNLYLLEKLRLVLRIRDTNYRFRIRITLVTCAQINGIAGGVAFLGRSLDSNFAKTHLNDIMQLENTKGKEKLNKNELPPPWSYNNESLADKGVEILSEMENPAVKVFEPRVAFDEDDEEEAMLNAKINIAELTRLASEAGLRNDGSTLFIRDLCEAAQLNAVQRISIAPGNPTIYRVANNAPYFGTVMLRNEVGDYFFCGATLIAPTYVLTAASCLLRQGYDSNMYEITAYFDLVNDIGLNLGRTYEILWARTPRYDVKRVVFHPMYDHNNFHYDIAVMELATEVTGNTPVALPERGNLYENVAVTEMGNGIRNQLGVVRVVSYTRFAYRVPGTTLTVAECQSAYSAAPNRYTSYNGVFIKDEMICIEANDEHQVCEGDQGGPVVTGYPGSAVLVGIISGNQHNCVDPDLAAILGQYPDIAVRITSVLDFINAATSNIQTNYYGFFSFWAYLQKLFSIQISA